MTVRRLYGPSAMPSRSHYTLSFSQTSLTDSSILRTCLSSMPSLLLRTTLPTRTSRYCHPYLIHLRLRSNDTALHVHTTELRDVGCLMGSHLPPDTGECTPPNPSQKDWYSIKLPLRDGRLSWPRWLATYRDGLPAHRRSPIQVLTGPGVK